MAYRGPAAPKTGTMPFADVKTGAYYYDAVLWAMENGITYGTSAVAFSPDATCTRAQIVSFLYRYVGSPAVQSGAVFSDVGASAYYADAVAWAATERCGSRHRRRQICTRPELHKSADCELHLPDADKVTGPLPDHISSGI